MNKNKHLIEKIFLEIDTNSLKVANSIKNNITVFIKNELLSIIELEFDRLSMNNNEIIQIEKLDISINTIENTIDFTYNSELKLELKKQIQNKLETVSNHSNTANDLQKVEFNPLSQKDKKSNTLIYFLTHGEMPWWISKLDNAFFSNQNLFEISKTTHFKKQFKSIIEKKAVQKRLLNQFSNNQIATLISSLKTSSKKESLINDNKVLDTLNKENFEFKELFWTSIMNYSKTLNDKSIVNFFFRNIKDVKNWQLSFTEFATNIEAFITLSDDLISITSTKKEGFISKKINKKDSNIKSLSEIIYDFERAKLIALEKEKDSVTNDTSDIEKTDANKLQENIKASESKEIADLKNNSDIIKKAIYVENAGLILLHPFIKELFKNCNLLDNNTTINNKELAVHILHYAATKKVHDYEHSMLFEKFLCGMPVQYPIKREIEIEEYQKVHVEELLSSVVEHWSALKNSSTDILRTEFLQREGKLDTLDSNPKLSIEKKTQDILLDKIPWNISIVKIPWIEKLIYTEW